MSVLCSVIFLLCLYTFDLYAHQTFHLFNGAWVPAFIQSTNEGWQHVYLCPGCRLTPSLTILSSVNPKPDNSLLQELERSFEQVIVEQETTLSFQHFTVLRAIKALAPNGPTRLTAILTRLPSGSGYRWHHVQAIIEQGAKSEEAIIEDTWITLLTNAKVEDNSLLISAAEQTAVVDLSSPYRTWLSDLADRTGLHQGILDSPVAATGLIIIGVQLALGISGVRGPCGKPLHQCPCTKKALQAVNLPSLPAS